MSILVTGAAGFIGSNFLLEWFSQSNERIISLDLLTYAGNLRNIKSIENHSHHHFFKGDINDRNLVLNLLKEFQIRAVVNFAAESHVDKSIHEPKCFIEANIMGVYNLLESTKAYWQDLNGDLKKSFRFLQVSTDEVYGSLELSEKPFTEKSSYQPNNPYSASKAASDHLVRAWFYTYGLPTLVTNCCNSFGPFQYPEKLIPLSIFNALSGKSLPIYGNGKQIRDWLYVKDHCSAIREVLSKGLIGQSYNVGGWNERTNLEVVDNLCRILDELKPKLKGSYLNQITFINDRPGHDKRYAIDAKKLEQELEWKPCSTFETGLRKTVKWYLENQTWINSVATDNYQNWIKKQYL
jgi:dTDP-glucose 4,6-dehydratase